MGTYSVNVDPSLMVHYKNLLEKENCVFSYPQYTFFCAKTNLWQFTFYKSGKVVIQGKEIDDAVKKFFDDKFGQEINSSGEIAPYPHIGIDESGKGDFFGPLVIAGCFLTEENAEKLKLKGVIDSKKLDDKKILSLSDDIKTCSIFDIVVIGNKKYNELYDKFKNLNRLLAWGHSTVLENILNKTNCTIAISDKFADESVIKNALKDKGKTIKLLQQTKAESDTAVAAASILARAEFVKRISNLSQKYEINLPKGAGQNVFEQGEKFIQKFGIEELINVSKTHFKTYSALKTSQKTLF